MKRRKLRRMVARMVEDAIDRERIGRELDRYAGVPSEEFPPLETFPTPDPYTVPGIVWPYITVRGTGTYTVRCTCPPNRGDNYAGSCPIHDVTTFS